MQNPNPFSGSLEESSILDGIPSFESFCDGLSVPSFRKPFKEISRKNFKNQLLSETVLEVDYKFSAEFDPYSPTLQLKKNRPQSLVGKENTQGKQISGPENVKRPNNLSYKDTSCYKPLPVESLAFADENFNPISEKQTDKKDGLQVIHQKVEPSSNQSLQKPAGSIKSLQTFSCLNDEKLSQKFLIPTIKDKYNPQLDAITPATLVNIMDNPDQFQLYLVDCRYEYEYRGGHINNAIHISNPQALQDTFFNSSRIEELTKMQDHLGMPVIQDDKDCPEKTVVVVFYCEFSQKRSPRALNAFRNADRYLNASRWPTLYYPNVYIIEGGYKNFHSQFPNACSPVGSYVEMLDLRYKKEYRIAKEEERQAWNIKPSFQASKPDTLAFRNSRRICDF